MNTPENVDRLRLIPAKFPRPSVSPSPAPPPKHPGTVRVITDNSETLTNALARIESLEAENKKLRTENQTLQDALAHWQGVVRVAREKDSTLPDPEAVPC